MGYKADSFKDCYLQNTAIQIRKQATPTLKEHGSDSIIYFSSYQPVSEIELRISKFDLDTVLFSEVKN